MIGKKFDILEYKQRTPQKFVLHSANPKKRAEILKHGLLPKIGMSYKCNWEEFKPIRPAIFAFNSKTVKSAFGLCYGAKDYDVWLIDTTKCGNVWYEDWAIGGKSIMTFEKIPVDCLTLIHSAK